MFKKQDKGKFEQISGFSLIKSLASKLQMSCERFVTNICLFFVSVSPGQAAARCQRLSPLLPAAPVQLPTELMSNYCFLAASV